MVISRVLWPKRSDGFETHAPVDGLGGESMTQLMGVDVTDAGGFGDAPHHAGDPVPTDRAGGIGEEHPVALDLTLVGVLVGRSPARKIGDLARSTNDQVRGRKDHRDGVLPRSSLRSNHADDRMGAGSRYEVLLAFLL
jgi:hypothetical protein